MFMDPDAEYVMMGDVRRDEKLLWAGRPAAGFALTPGDVFLTIFGLAWTAIPLGMLLAILFAESGQKGGESPPFLVIVPFLSIFILIGLYLVVGRHIFAARRRGRTFYGLTNERVIIKTNRMTTSFPLHNLQSISLTEKRDGRGTITLAPANPAAAVMPAGFPGTSMMQAPSLDLVPDAREVYQLIQQVVRASMPPAGL